MSRAKCNSTATPVQLLALQDTYLHQLALIAPEKNLPAGIGTTTFSACGWNVARRHIGIARAGIGPSTLNQQPSTNRHFDQFRPSSTNFDRKKIPGSLRAKKSALRSLNHLAPFCGFLRPESLRRRARAPFEFIRGCRGCRPSTLDTAKMVLFETKSPAGQNETIGH